MVSTTKLERDIEIREELKPLISKHGSDRTALKPILHELQSKYRGIDSDYIQILADMLNIHAIEVQEVVSFYSFYNTDIKGKYVIRMCRTMPCEMAGAKEVAEGFEKVLGIKFGETTPDGKFTLEWTNCIGMCDLGPALLINEIPYTKVSVNDIEKIIKECK
jgi:NADH:ubiquinone oxidoreductase subunit E